MEKIREFFGRFELEYHRGRNVTKIVATVAILLSICALVALQICRDDVANKTRELQSKAAVITQENTALAEDIAGMGSVKSVEQIAEQELDLVNPNAVIFTPNPES